jgi:CMP-N,N'-diacetyllegionaminic acid synthase
MENKRILITICARGGSKGVKNKNIRELGGKPLIAHTIDVAKKWGRAARIICSTDSEKIAQVAREYGIEVPFVRPAELATDTAGKVAVIKHALAASEEIYNEIFDIVVDLDVTSPLRTVEDLDNCLKIFNEKGAEVLLSAVEARKNPYFNMLELNENGFAEVSKKPKEKILRRQDAPKVYDANACIYFYSRKFLLDPTKEIVLSSEKVALYVMKEESAIDIDTEADFSFMEYMINKGLIRIGDENVQNKGAGKMKTLKELFDLNGKVALITGAGGNLGIVHAEALAELGCNLVLADVFEERIKIISGELMERYGVKAVPLKIDLFQKESIQEVFKKVNDLFGRLDVLVNNAQFTCPEDIETVDNFSKEVWEKVMGVNVTAVFLCCQEAIKYMKAGGVILNMSSIMGVVAPDRRIYEGSYYDGKQMNSPLVYTTSKSAIIGLTKYLAADLANRRIRVNSISPAGFESGQSELFKSKYNNKIPLNRMANKEELKGAVAYLCSDASSFVTGHNLIMDGGMTCW